MSMLPKPADTQYSYRWNLRNYLEGVYNLKDYEHIIVWLDYFNKTFPRSKGRRVDKERCVFDPSLKELVEAARSAGFETVSTEEKARYPKRPYVKSGYITLPKGSPKTKILDKISEKLLAKRAKKSK